MTAENSWAKSDGDILYASETNIMQRSGELALTNLISLGLDGGTTTNQENLKIDLFGSDTASYLTNMEYDSGNNYYSCIDFTDIYYVEIEATSLTISDFTINSCKMIQMSSGSWFLYRNDGADAETNKASVIKTLFFGSNGTDARSTSTYITGLTALKTSAADDVGKQAHYAYLNDAWTSGQLQGSRNNQYTGTFADTSTNTDCNAWSNVVGTGTGTETVRFEFPESTTVNTTGGAASNEIGTDTSGDDQSNPADCQLSVSGNNGAGETINMTVRAVILCKGDITWVNSATGYDETVSNIDFFTDESVPLFTASTLTDTTCILQTASTTITSSDKDVIVKSIHSLTGANTIVTEVSFDNGSNWSTVTQERLAVISNTGTNFLVKFTITRATNAQTDYITSYGAYYNTRS